MWQVILGIYLVVLALVVLLLWSTLVLAKRADRQDKQHRRPGTGFALGGKKDPIEREALKLPKMKELSKK